EDLRKALPDLEKSLEHYSELVSLTKGTYLYANSMQTQQRKIPMRGVNGTYKTWAEVLVPFEKELEHFKHAIDSLQQHPASALPKRTALTNVTIQWTSPAANNQYTVDSSARIFSDTSLALAGNADELKGLHGLQLSYRQMRLSSTDINFINTAPIKVLVGYF